MRIKGFFGILVFLLLVLGGGLLFLSSRLNMIYFYIGEGLVLFILCYLPFFYRKIVKPLNSIGSGMELLREQDFSSRLSPVGQYEADRIVNVFNWMMEQLKNERLRLREQNNFLDLLIKASPMGVILTTLDEDLSELNPMAQKMLGVRQEDVLGKKMNEIDSPLAAELANVPKGETATVRLNDSNIYRCTHSSFIDRGFQHPFFLIESLTDEVMKAEKKAYEKVIRMIAHEVNNTTAGITSTLDTVEQALSTEEGMDDICDVMRVCTERCFSMSRFITRFADVVKIPEPTLTLVDLNDLAFTCKRFMEGMCTDPEHKTSSGDRRNAERGKNGCLPLRTGIGKHHQECCGKHREGWRDYRPHPFSCHCRSGGQRQGNQQRGGSEAVQPVLLHQAQWSGNRTDLYPGGSDASRLYLLSADLCRRINQIPYSFSLIKCQTRTVLPLYRPFFVLKSLLPLPRSIQ